jgi:ring-1,2-phenylacetyl-CoA epoxidase subunit PaaD
MTPTFVGCPAVDLMRAEIQRKIESLGAREVTVRLSFDPPWNSDRVSEAGRRKLKDFGLAPPRPHGGLICLSEILPAVCPYCDSSDTALESAFGPTLCRAIHYCNTCRQSFEQFKPL